MQVSVKGVGQESRQKVQGARQLTASKSIDLVLRCIQPGMQIFKGSSDTHQIWSCKAVDETGANESWKSERTYHGHL